MSVSGSLPMRYTPTMNDPRTASATIPPQPVGLWWIVFCVIMGAVVLGVLMPIFLIVAALGSIAVPVLASREARERLMLSRELIETQASTMRAQGRASLLRGLIDSADIPILATDADGVLLNTNSRAAKVLGIHDRMLGRRFDELFTQPVLDELETLSRGGEPGHARASIPIHGEMRDFDISADPVPVCGGAVLTFRDITELSRAVTLKADFAANASHELRTPIASIKGAAETLLGPARNDERMLGRLIEMISNNANRLELLARDLLDLSKLEAEDLPVEVQQTDLSVQVQGVLGEFAHQAERRKLRLVAEIDDSIVVTRTDPVLLKLMLSNLVSNAIKFAHEGSAIRVVARRAHVPVDRSIPMPDSLSIDDEGLLLQVIDKGVGIPIEHQQRVFERFYQVDEARSGSAAKRGTGLGLAIVKHAARRLGGSVTLESVYQSGTTISIELPRCVKLAPSHPSE